MDSFQVCPKYEAAFGLLGKRWNGLILHVMMNGPKRFNELTETIPNISQKMLAERLKELEECGIVIRSVYPETPVRIEYALTQKGTELQRSLTEIQHWAEKWM
ncbi:helix-turn-helix domain-containing protein [Bacillus sp. 165]|uniref:winged helix-turn-helix transcriptional regulator n=1 Tax=Bacillus sp. 165 TaxID=1529117 RepID=UPI001ADD223E|nr:helix-turn-helix domain-containing protein [Bacillus sp. 165]MBO9129863.1 helix-turn-helix transcriptional regulator [Bacillus sp. 165]